MSGRSHDRSFIHYTAQGRRLYLVTQTEKKGIPCHSTPGIPPTGLTTTGFNSIKTDAGIPFQTRGGIPPEALPAKASG